MGFAESDRSVDSRKCLDFRFRHQMARPVSLLNDVLIHYADTRGGPAAWRIISVWSAHRRDNDIMIEAYCHLRQARRSFLGCRVIDVSDIETGEEIDRHQWFADLLGIPVAEVGQTITAVSTRSVRTAAIKPVFGQDGLAEGWHFGVSLAFRAALDIELTTYKVRSTEAGKTEWLRAWTQGLPPNYSFDVGDFFVSPPRARLTSWAEALPLLTDTIVVTGQTDGRLTCECRQVHTRIVGPPDVQHWTQDELVTVLRDGRR